MSLLPFLMINFLFVYPYVWVLFKLQNHYVWKLACLDNIFVVLLILMLQLCLGSAGITFRTLDTRTQILLTPIFIYYCVLIFDKVFLHFFSNNNLNPIIGALFLIAICYNFYQEYTK